MKSNVWKTLAIIFIILTVIETAFLIWAYVSGGNIIERENECVYNICSGYDTFYYDDYEQICYCYIDGEIEHSEFMG